jgi:ATP-binding cassette, subfamily B, bacterial
VTKAAGGDGKGPIGLLATVGHAFRYWRPHWRLAIALLAALTVPQAFKAFFAYSQRIIVDKGLLGHDGSVLAAVLVALAVAFVVAFLAALLADYLGARVGAAIINSIRAAMFRHLQRLSVGYYARSRSGDIVARFTSDLTDIQKSLTTRIVDAGVAMLGLAINVPVAFFLDWRLAAVMVTGMPLAGAGTRLWSRRAATARYALKQEEASVASTVSEAVRAQPVVKVFGLTGWLEGRFARQLQEVQRRFVRAEFLSELVGSSSSLGVLVIQVVVLGVGAWMAFSGHITTGCLVAFLSLHAVISKDAYDLTKKVIPALIASSGGLQRIEELLGEPLEVSDAPAARELTSLAGPLRLEDVSFGYAAGNRVLDHVTLEIGPGQRLALVGPSGSGKSTVLQLLLRFYDPQEGRVTAAGADLRSVTEASLHAHMAAVFQESFLFAGTVRENIALGKLGASDQEIFAAARAAEIHEAILGLPDGYDTPVGEAGGRLSGGQRQRVAIARAVLHDPAVLLLDEATSALDPATETAINVTLERLATGRMVVTVTHRLAAARSADRIVVMDHGRIAESGTHEELLAMGGLYRSLWDKQGGVEVSPDGGSARVDAQRLAAVPLFASLSADERAAVASNMRVLQCDTDALVIREGERGDKLFVVARGKVAVTAGGSERPLAVLSDGDFFGEMALLSDAPRVATVRALQPCTFLVLDKQAFESMLEGNPDLRAAVDRVRASRLGQVAQTATA